MRSDLGGEMPERPVGRRRGWSGGALGVARLVGCAQPGADAVVGCGPGAFGVGAWVVGRGVWAVAGRGG
jgi:hypothetical protein